MTHDDEALLRNNIEGVLRRCTLKSSGATTDEVLKVISVALAAKDAEIARLGNRLVKALQDATTARSEFVDASATIARLVVERNKLQADTAALCAQVERMKRAIVDIVPEDDVTDSDEVEIGPVRRRKYWRNLAAAAEKEPQA